jgi:hypothetical protein
MPQVDELWCVSHLLEARFAQQGGVKNVFQSPRGAVLDGVHFVGHRLCGGQRRHALE